MQTPRQYADYSTLRIRLAELRSTLDDIRHEIYWDDRLGNSCGHLNRALEHIKAARDCSHEWEHKPHPLLDQQCESTSSSTSTSSSSSPAEMSFT